MPISDLPEPLQDYAASLTPPRWEPVGTYHATETLYCLVKAQLNHHFTEEMLESDSPPPKGNINWAIFRGQFWHESFSAIMGGDMQMTLEWPYGDETLTMLGTNDWREWDPIKNGPWIGELKTCKNIYWYAKNGPGENHLQQVAVYMRMLQSMGEKPLGARFYYLDMTDVIGYKSYPLLEHVYTDEEIEEVVEESKDNAERMHDAYTENRIIDERRDWKTSWECNPAYCQFTRFCHEDNGYPFEPPEDYPHLKEWFAGSAGGKVKKKDIAKLLDPAVVEEMLRARGVALPPWRTKE